MTNYYQKLVALENGIDNHPDYNEDDIKDTKEFVVEAFSKLPEYFSTVIMVNVEVSMMDSSNRNPYKIQTLDEKRRLAHIAATNAINQINRLSKEVGLKENFFLFPEMNDQPLFAGSLHDIGDDAKRAAHDRELAAFRIYGFCKQMFLYSKDKRRYNKFEAYSEKEMEEELDTMANESRPVLFDKTFHDMNELIDAAHDFQ